MHTKRGEKLKSFVIIIFRFQSLNGVAFFLSFGYACDPSRD